MISRYFLKQGPKVYFTNIRIDKIDGSTLKMFQIVLASFQTDDKLEKALFFKETFLLPDFSIEMILKMFFLILSNENI